MHSRPASRDSFAVLQQFVRKKRPAEICELCGAALPSEHQHLIEPESRRLACSCDACAILFSGQQGAKYRRVPRRVEGLPDFRMTDEQWEILHIPINLAFFFRSVPAQRVVVLYPSPAGATESLLSFESWCELEEANPVLREMEPDVEALLVNRVRQKRDYYRVPIDHCYKLIGIIRANWRGLSGGTEVWEAIDQFFAGLHAQWKSHAGPAL